MKKDASTYLEPTITIPVPVRHVGYTSHMAKAKTFFLRVSIHDMYVGLCPFPPPSLSFFACYYFFVFLRGREGKDSNGPGLLFVLLLFICA